MVVYWLLYLFPIFLLLHPFRANKQLNFFTWCCVGIIFACVIGFRWEIGTDWFNYLPIMDSARDVDFFEALSISDPGYMAINWLSLKLGTDIIGVNVVCGVFFVVGLSVFCKRQPIPWLAFAIAIPYLFIAVSMGYTRQSAALGFVFLALISLQDNRTFLFVSWVILAALFHKSAVVIFPLLGLCSGKHGKIRLIFIFILTLLAGITLVLETLAAQWTMYVEDQMHSDGAGIRIFMNLIPAVLFLIFRKKWKLKWPESFYISKWLAIGAIICVPLLQVASTATDRLALYVAPLQIIFFSRLPFLVQGNLRGIFLLGTIFYYGFILYIWLNYSFYAQNYWIPYQFLGFNK